MNLTGATWTYVVVTLLCLLRATYLSYVSSGPLFPTPSVPDLPNTPVPSLNDAQPINDTQDNLFYFVQVSDLHISKYYYYTQHFVQFIHSVLPLLSPKFVVVTGDLTDAKDNGHIKTLQYEEEWHVYKSLVDQGTPDELPWYDMRGNHDCFNVPQWDSRINMYRQFGKSAALLEEGNGVYSWALDAPFEKHQFIAMDPCPTKGIARPINFFGYVTPAIIDRLAALMLTNEKKPDYSHTFMFTHYPTTVTAFGESTHGHRFSDILQRVSVYFCGHLHRLGYGIGDVLKSFHTSTQSLELELGDMKDHGVYRILAVDHDIVSFVDVDLPRLEIDTDTTPLVPLDDNEHVIWPNSKLALAPIVLITNPKDARFALGEKEPAHRIRQSTHARFLVFSAHDPAQLKVQVFINDERLRDTPVLQGKNLWTVPWHPQELDIAGKHTFRVRVDAPDGQITDTSVPFRLDGDRMPIRGGMGEWIISTSMASIFRTISLLAVLLTLTLVLGPRIYQEAYDSMATTKILVALHADDASLPFVMRWTRRQGLSWLARCFLWQQAMPAMYTATWLFILACWTLPWFYGDFVPSGGVHGWFYMWGIMFDGEWLPIGDTWMYAAMHLSFDVAPFMLLMLWRSTNTADLVCPRRMPMNMSTQSPSSSSPITKFLTFCHRWSMSIIACAFWVFRWKSVLSIAGFYGSIALVYNLLVWWMLAVAWMLLMEKGGVFALWRHAKAQHVPLLLDECPTCRQLAPDHPAFSPAVSNASVDAISVILTAADHNSLDIDDRDQLSSSSASSIDTQRIAINSRKRSPSSQLGNTP